jgi:hypothetical protein
MGIGFAFMCWVVVGCIALNRTNQLWDSGIGHRDHREHRGKRACAFPLRALCVLCGYCLNLVWSDLACYLLLSPNATPRKALKIAVTAFC